MAENQSAQKGAEQTKNNKPCKSDERLAYNIRLNDNKYTFMNIFRGRIQNRILNVVLKDVSVDIPKLLRTGNGRKYQSKYGHYHWETEHDIDDCF